MTPNQAKVAAIIANVIAIWTDGRGVPAPLISIAKRESNLKPHLVGDVTNGTAAKSWARNKRRIAAAGNPWTDQDMVWAQSIGLYQMMPANVIDKWDIKADPKILFDPVLTTIVACRLFNRGVQLAKKNGNPTPTAVDVRMLWAYGPKGLDIAKTDKRYLQRVTTERRRWKELGLAGDPASIPAESFHLEAFGTGPQPNQNEISARIRSGIDTPVIPSETKFPLIGFAAFLFAIWGLS